MCSLDADGYFLVVDTDCGKSLSGMYILGVYYLRNIFCFTECSFAYVSNIPKSNFVLLDTFYDIFSSASCRCICRVKSN